MRTKQQPPVRWLSLPALWQRTKRQVLAHVIGRFVDPRDAFAPLDASVEPLAGGADGTAGGGDVWVDYVSDVGDGYQATRAVAYCQSRPLGHTTPGDLLIFGGDQVYPVASTRAYERRFQVPYGDLLGGRRLVLSIPGNHDWYDMLQSFPELFTRGRSASLPNAGQRCSYWSTPVPGGSWWIWGLDFGLRGVLDEAQRAHFVRQRDALAALARPIGLVICTAEPYWQKGEAAIAAAVEELIPANASSVLHISGDKHHFAVWQDDGVAALERERIYLTAGGGGAYLSLTDDVPVTVPLQPTGPAEAAGDATLPTGGLGPSLPRRDVYPEPGAWKAASLLPALGPRGWQLDQLGLLPVLGAAYTALGGLLGAAAVERAGAGRSAVEWATQGSWPGSCWRLLGAAAGNGWCRLGGLAVLGATVGLALEKGKPSKRRRAALGTAHGLAHGVAVVGVAATAMELAAMVSGAQGVVYVLAAGVIGSFVGNAVFVGYLAVAGRRGFNLNEVAAAIGSPHQKNFVRLRFGADGVLEVIPFTIERTDRAPEELVANCEQRVSYRLVPDRPAAKPLTTRTAAR